MHAPLYSTIALTAEMLVSAAVYYTFYSGYRRGRLPEKLAIITIIYETIFDISYMVLRVPANDSKMLGPWYLALGATHGILSLTMFIALVVYFVLAIKNYRRKVNYFRLHQKVTFTFLTFWTISVLSGIALYIVAYR